MFWGGGSGGFGGGGGFGIGGGGSGSSGHWEKQYYGTSINEAPYVWHGYDWIWEEHGIRVYHVSEFLKEWAESKITRKSVLLTRIPIWVAPYNLIHIAIKSRSRADWDLKPLLYQSRTAMYEFQGSFFVSLCYSAGIFPSAGIGIQLRAVSRAREDSCRMTTKKYSVSQQGSSLQARAVRS